MGAKKPYEIIPPTDSACLGHIKGTKRYCKKSPGWGTNHVGVGRCKLHGGAAPTYMAEVHRLRAEAAIGTFGLPVEIDPQEALLQELERTVGHVQFLQIKVNELEESNMIGPVGGAQGGFPEYKANVWIVMLNWERKHLESIGKTCVACGIAERRVRLAEQQGELLARVIQGILKDLGVDKDKRAPEVVRRHLTLVADNETAAA